jgi:hypothetical protein
MIASRSSSLNSTKETIMTTSNSRTVSTGVTIGHSETAAEQDFNLPDDFRQLTAMTAAAKVKMDELQTTRAEALRTKWTEEAAALGMTPDEVLHGIDGKKKRGRKPRQKRDE